MKKTISVCHSLIVLYLFTLIQQNKYVKNAYRTVILVRMDLLVLPVIRDIIYHRMWEKAYNVLNHFNVHKVPTLMQ